MDNINLSDLIPESANNERLDRALAILWPQYSREQHKGWIIEGMVKVDNETILKPRHKITSGQHIEINATVKEQTPWKAEEIPLNIVFEDKDILVIDKPSNLVVHPGAGNHNSTLANALLHHAPEISHLPRCGLVHRLDKDTTGLLISAKTIEAYNQLIKSMQEREIHRHYQAIVQGVIISGGSIDEPIGRHKTSRTKMSVSSGGKVAVTHYLVEKRFAAHTLLNLQLETGRTHQIRVHLTHRGYPIIGDRTYKKQIALERSISNTLQSVIKSFPRQALHARRLELNHPVSHQSMVFESPLPDDMSNLITALQKDTDNS